MSEELATTSDTEDGDGGAVAAFVIGAIVASAAWGAAIVVKNYGAWKERRKLKKSPEVIVVEDEKTVQDKK